jgi:hypothetical protein
VPMEPVEPNKAIRLMGEVEFMIGLEKQID